MVSHIMKPKERCGNINGTVIMPKTEADARWIAVSMSFGSSCWIGLADYDADYIYTWEDGINEPSSELYWNGGSNQQPNGRDNAYLCTVMRNGEMYDVDCNTNNRVICQVNATTELPTTFYRQTTNHADLETTTLPTTNTSLTLTATLLATNTSFTLTTLECEELWMHQRKCNCQEPSAIPEIPNDIITYRLDKTTLSSYIRKRNSASDPRKSSFYIGCVGITVLVLSVLFIVVLDFLPRG
ncbi:MRC [Mytilus coruscus]|uniref:MRC n=1 Tax=Mytilus coruscus TaxID=42192 RepID=A0A6J8CFF9_MYTCO|nr:MRC [Mytilus coruscus]